MSEQPQVPGGIQDIPEVTVEEPREGFSIVWLIPLVALAIGGWVAYKTISEQGPTITITFKDGESLEAGKTKVKYKAVEVGVVETVVLNKDLSGVTVTATLGKYAEPHLKEGVRFWVVRPRISATQVTGLDTLVSGAYIEMEVPLGPGEPKREFVGLDEPPVVKVDEPGRKFMLHANELGSLSAGSPIYFRGIKVGEILGYKMSDDKKNVRLPVFIAKPHDQLVFENTRFWVRSGIDISVTADGMQVKTGSLETLLAGGIAFDVPPSKRPGKPAEEGSGFKLFNSYDETLEVFTEYFDLIAYFDGSVRGLQIGAPVEFRGIKIGTVHDMHMEFLRDSVDVRIPVVMRLERGRVRVVGGEDNPKKNLRNLIKKGLRAQLQTGSMLTGQLYVEWDFHPDAPIKLVGASKEYLEVPTIPTTLDQVAESATDILKQIKALPLDELINRTIVTIDSINRLVDSEEVRETVVSLNKTLVSFNKLAENLDTQVVSLGPNLEETTESATAALKQGEQTLKEVEVLVGENSQIRVDLSNSLRELSATARSLRILAEYLERHPEALVHGKGGSRR